ncbi:unnamed protein product [Peronospora belbahrii]|uniref:Uncharacterized protein n=1 Tax=Peronospora belbahrii TaxID=622444 RepID=A0ABN8CNG6_9STRA|nr:unnamed protein product [Peronospora belbahrii]
MPPTSHHFFHFTPVMMKNIKEAATCGGFDKDGVNEFSYFPHQTLGKLARRLRESIIQSDEIFLRDAINFLAEHSNAGCVQLSNNFLFGPDLVFSSWVHLGMYNAEFDGTHPWYASFPRMTCYDGRVIITEAQKGGEGIDVGVFLVSKAMEKLKKMFSEVSYLNFKSCLSTKPQEFDVNVVNSDKIESSFRFNDMGTKNCLRATHERGSV